jgi:hypothetical protein
MVEMDKAFQLILHLAVVAVMGPLSAEVLPVELAQLLV